jgi:hypothetical protein
MTVFNFGDNLVTSMEALERLYAAPGWAALAKETDRIIAPYRAFIEAAPYVTLATAGPYGVDCSPRGGAPGFVRVHDDKTLLIPDRPSNDRIDPCGDRGGTAPLSAACRHQPHRAGKRLLARQLRESSRPDGARSAKSHFSPSCLLRGQFGCPLVSRCLSSVGGAGMSGCRGAGAGERIDVAASGRNRNLPLAFSHGVGEVDGLTKRGAGGLGSGTRVQARRSARAGVAGFVALHLKKSLGAQGRSDDRAANFGF